MVARTRRRVPRPTRPRRARTREVVSAAGGYEPVAGVTGRAGGRAGDGAGYRMRFVRVASLSEVPPGKMKCIEVDGQEVVLVNVGGEIHAVGNRCPHQGGPLGRGRLEGDVITCPWHGWRWSACSGRAVWPPVDWRASVYPVKVEGADILVGAP